MNRILTKHEVRVDASSLPADIATLLHGYTFFNLVRNYPAPTNVYRTVRAGYPNFFLKVGRYLKDEHDRLSWLENKLLLPNIVTYSLHENREFLLLTKIAGLPADDEEWFTDIASMIEVIAEGVRTIHSLPQADCPFDASAEALMTKAERVVRFQLLNQNKLSAVYRNRTINDLFNELIHLFPANEDIVFTHGDLCLPNIIIQNQTSVGFVDLGLAGLGDPHRDLSLIVRSINRNFGEKWVRFFFDAYGHDVDKRKMEFYTLLDQFIMARKS